MFVLFIQTASFIQYCNKLKVVRSVTLHPFPPAAAFDLPQRPNEGHVFYGNMSKVVLSLLGTTSRLEPGEVERAEPVQHSTGHAEETHR